MGCTISQETSQDSVQSKHVDDYLYDSKIESLLDFKILLLGAGESGKSTVVKQLKVLHKVQMDEMEMQSYAVNIHKNTVQCMQILLDAQQSLMLAIEDPEAMRRAESVKSFVFSLDHKRVPSNIAEDIEFLWKDPSIMKIWDRRSEYWFLDATPYYIENLHRFMEDGYVPTEEDIIMTRVRTTGIAQTELDEGPVHFRVVDVGGQRNERKKCDVRGSNAEPNEGELEPVYPNIFEQMIQQTDLSKCFEDYSGGNDVNEAMKFIKEQFQAKVKDNRGLHVYFIAARFKKDVKYTWEEVKKILIDENKKQVQHATKHQQKKSQNGIKV